jgi:hypothetical protein
MVKIDMQVVFYGKVDKGFDVAFGKLRGQFNTWSRTHNGDAFIGGRHLEEVQIGLDARRPCSPSETEKGLLGEH